MGMNPSVPDAVVFDLDGTLVDTVPTRILAWREVLAEHGFVTDDATLAPMIGMDGRRLAREVAEHAGRGLDDDDAERIDREAGERFDAHNREPRPLPGAHDVLARLDAAGITWAIATSSRAEQVRGSVASLDLARPPRIVDGSRVPHAKPAPDLLLLAAHELDLAPDRCWYVGDSTWDMRASVAAGMAGVGVLAGAAVERSVLDDAGASLVVESLGQLPIPD
jgi:HAD superfamily hydrolase (TIGR01509 family)